MAERHIYRQWVDEQDVGNTCCLEPRFGPIHIPALTRYRYRVTETWGDVPEQISRLVGEPTGFLLYPEYRGIESDQQMWQDGMGVVGGWDLRYHSQVDLDPETMQLVGSQVTTQECPSCGHDHPYPCVDGTCDCCEAIEHGPEYVTCSLCGATHTGSHHCG